MWALKTPYNAECCGTPSYYCNYLHTNVINRSNINNTEKSSDQEATFVLKVRRSRAPAPKSRTSSSWSYIDAKGQGHKEWSWFWCDKGTSWDNAQARHDVCKSKYHLKEMEECCHHLGGAISEISRRWVRMEERGYLPDLESSRTCRI